MHQMDALNGTMRFPMINNRMFFVSLLALSACADEAAPKRGVLAADLLEDTMERSIWDGTAEGVAVLAFLNAEDTTTEILDYDVPLDRRAAGNLIAHRDGGDARWGTTDDDIYNDLDEVDDVRWVGPASLNRLADYVVRMGLVPAEDDILGTWDGVGFTVAEAEAVVELANTAGPNTLDDAIGLDSRAANSIVDARPVSTVSEIAGLYYVGKSALNKLKDYAAGEPGCEVPGWETEYVYASDAEPWEDKVPAELVALVDHVLKIDDWCGEADGNPWFVKATIDRFECVEKGYTLELGQGMLEYPEISWYIEFEVDMDFGLGYGVCEV
jgi:hypothetical protein